ncbi:MAG TPA: hypothetical protein VGI75_06005 [Pirellulales bacterium]|jgi:hypothetical protein
MNISRIAIASAVACLGLIAQHAQADDWGTLSGRFIYDGKAPAAEAITPNKDLEVCGKHPLVDEGLVVGPDGGLANVFVWVRTKNVKVAPEYEKTAKDKVVLDNKNCRFEPHALAMRNSQQLEVKNDDPVSHNTNADLQVNSPFNGIIPAGSSNDMKLASAETTPVKISCNIHPWMLGYLLVRPDPYFAVSDKDGKFQIKDLPAGTELEFQVWHEKPAYVKKAKIDDKDAGWKNGRFKYTIKAGDNNLGDIKLDPSQFK